MKLVGGDPYGVVLVPGTWAWRGAGTKGQWYQDGSLFVAWMEAHGIDVLSKQRPYVWNTRINGLPIPTNRLDWEAAGNNLYAYVDPAIPEYGVSVLPRYRNIIAHSHGLQVALYAAAAGCKVNCLVSVGSPIREDMLSVVLAARKNITRWLHICGGRRDVMQWVGELFDGHLGAVREAVWRDDAGKPIVSADQTIRMNDIRHSDMLYDPKYLGRWESEGCLDFIIGSTEQAVVNSAEAKGEK